MDLRGQVVAGLWPRVRQCRSVVVVLQVGAGLPLATLTEGYDLDYIWQQVDRGPAKDAAGYYVQAGQSGGVEGDRPDEGGKSRPSYGHCAAT